MSLLDSQERFLYFRTAERITDLPAFKKSLGKRIELFPTPPKYYAEDPDTGKYLYKVKVNLTRRFFLKPAGGYRPGQYYVDHIISAYYSDDIAKVAEVLITHPETILELEELGIYDRSITIEDLLKDKAAAHGIDVKVVQEKVETFLEQEAQGHPQDLPTEVNQILSTLDEKTTSVAVKNNEIILNQGMIEYYQSQREKQQQELERLKQEALDPAQRLTMSYQELEREQMGQILGGASPERAIQRLNSLYGTQGFDQQQRLDLLQRLIGPSLGNLEFDLQNQSIKLTGLSAYASANVEEVSRISKLHDSQRLAPLPPPRGFISRPTAETYRSLFAKGNVKAVHFQLQEETVLADLLTADPSRQIELLTQGMDPSKIEDPTARSIFLANEVYASLDLSVSQKLGIEPRITRIYYDYSFHPKIGYVYQGTNPNRQIDAAYIGTQNLTAALERKHSVENIMVFRPDSQYQVESKIARQIVLATDLLHEHATQVLSGQSKVVDRNAIKRDYNYLLSLASAEKGVSKALSLLPAHLRGLVPRLGKKKYVYFNEEVQDRMLHILKEVFGSKGDVNTKVVLSFGDISALYATGDNQIKSVIRSILTSGQASRLKILTSQDQLFSYLESTQGQSNLVKDLVGAGVIQVVPTGLQHDKSYAVFRDNQLVALGTGSSNLSLTSRFHDVEVGVYIGALKRSHKDELNYLSSIQHQVSAYYQSLLTTSQNTLFTAENTSSLQATQLLYESLSKLQAQMGSEAFTLNARYDLERSSSLAAGVMVKFGGRNLVFTVNQSGQVVIANDKRVIGGSIFKNDTKADWLLDLSGMKRSLKPGEAVALNSMQTALSLVGSIATAMRLEYNYGTVNSAFAKAGQERMIVALDKLMGDLMAKYTNVAGRSLRGILTNIWKQDHAGMGDRVRQFQEALFKTITAVAAQMYSTTPMMTPFKDGLPVDYSQRSRVLLQLFKPIFDIDPSSRRALVEISEVWDDVRDRLVGRLTSETGGIASSFLLQDLKLRLLQYDDYGISLLQSHRQSLLNQVISAMTSAFLPSHEAGGSAAQRAARLVYYSVGQHYSTSSLNTQELYGAMGFAFTNPGVLKHGQDIGLPPGSVFRSLSSTAFPSYTDYHNLDLLRILATTDGEYAGAAVVYDSNYAFKAGPALQYRTEQEYYDYALQYLQSVGADTSLLNKPALPDRRLFLLPFSKPEQITQRLKNYFGAKQMFEVSPEFLRALHRGDFGVKMQDYVAGSIATSVSQVQYEELMALMQSGRKDISDYYRQQLIQNESAISGFIKGASMRRVAFALGYGQYGDSIYANEAFFDERLFGSTHTFNIRINPQGFNQPQQFVADLKRKLAGAVIYTQSTSIDPNGDFGVEITRSIRHFLSKYEKTLTLASKKLSQDRVDAIIRALNKKLSAFLKYQYKFADIDFDLYNGGFGVRIKSLSLRKGVYNYVDGKIQRVFEFDQQGRIRLAGQSTSTSYAIGLDELSTSLPGYSRRYSNAVAMIDPNINVVVSGNMLVLQGNSYVLFRPSTGDRGGEGYQVKGPLQILNRTIFDTIHGNFTANEFRGVRAGLQNQSVMAILHPGLTKGFTYESGLDLIAEDSSRLTLLDTMRMRSLDTLLSVTLLLGAGKQSQNLRDAFISAYSLQGDTQTAQLIKYGWAQFTTSKSRTNLIQQAFGLIKLAGGGGVSPEAVLDRIRERLLVSLTDDNARTSLLADITNLISNVASSAPSFSPGLRTSNEGDFDVRAAGLLADAFSITTQILHNRPLDLQGKHLTEISLVDANNQPKLAQYKQDEQYRLKVQSIMTRLGVAYSDLPRLPNESDTDYQQRNDEALANKMQFVQLLLNRQIFVERAVAYNPSRSLAATGMKDTVGLEYHYMAGMSAKQYHRLTSYMPGLTKDDYTTLASAYSILTQINVHTDALTEFQAMRLRSTIVPDIDADIGNRLVTNFTEFAYDAPVFAGDRQTTIFEATMEKVLSASTEADKLAAVEAYEHLAKLALGKDDTDNFDARLRLSKFLADQQTSDALKVLGISISYTPNFEEKGVISPEVLKQNKLLEDILTRSLQLGPERVAPALSAIDDTNRISSGLLAIQAYGEKTGNQRLQNWARTTTLQMLPSFRILPTDDGNFKLRFMEDGYEYGVMLGTDVLSSVVLTSPGYAGGPATNQLRMRQLEPQVRAILSTYEVSHTLTPYEASLLMEYRRLMQESVTDTISLATTEYSRRVTGEGLPNPGMSATAISGYLADIGEVFVGGMRTNHMMPQIAQMIANLEKIHAGVASGKVTDAKSVLKAHLYKRLKSKGLDRVVASMFRAGGPSFASVINQEHEVGSIEELIRRAESNNSALGLARGYAGQAVYMPSVGRFFTQGGDFDGDSYAFMLNRERYFNEYVSLVMQDIEERAKLLDEELKLFEMHPRSSGQPQVLTQEVADSDKQIEPFKRLAPKHVGVSLGLFKKALRLSKKLSEKGIDVSDFSRKVSNVVDRFQSMVNKRGLKIVRQFSSPTPQEVDMLDSMADNLEFAEKLRAALAGIPPFKPREVQTTSDPFDFSDPLEDIDFVLACIDEVDHNLTFVEELANTEKEWKRRVDSNFALVPRIRRPIKLTRSIKKGKGGKPPRPRKVDKVKFEKVRLERAAAVARRINNYRSAIAQIDNEIVYTLKEMAPSMSFALAIRRRLKALRHSDLIQQDESQLIQQDESQLETLKHSDLVQQDENRLLTDSGLVSPTIDSEAPTPDQAPEEMLDLLKDPRILEYEKLVDPQILEYEKRLQEFQSAFQEQQKKIDSDIRRWTASYTGLPQTFFADGGDGAFTLAEVMHLNEQFRGISTLSDMGENQDAKRLMRYVEIFGELGGTVTTAASAQQMVNALRSHGSYATLLQEDRERIEDYITAAYGNNEYSYDKGKSAFESYIADQIQRLRSLSATNTKVFGNAAGTVIDAVTFDALQAVIGTQGTSLIGEAYNAITPLMYSGIANFAFSFALKGSSNQLLSAFRGVASTENASEMQLIAKLEGVDFSEVVIKADRRWKAISGLLGNVQQIARDSLKEKTSKGVLDRLTQQIETEDGRSMTLAEYIQDPEASSEERQLRVKNFMSVEGGTLKSFGAIFLLSDYMKASSLDLEQLVKAKPGDDLRMWLSSQYELAGRPVDVDTFMASTVLKQLQRVSAEFSVGKMLAEGNVDYLYEGFAKRAAANLRAADTSIAYESLSDYERLLRDTGDVFNEQYISAFRDFPQLSELGDRRSELERRLMQLHDYEANREGGVSVDMIKFLRRLRNQRSFTEGEEAVVQTLEYLQRGKLSAVEHQGILARMLSSAEANDYDNPLSNYLGVVSSEVIKDMHLTEAEAKLFSDLMIRGEKGSRPVDILTQYSAGVSEWVRMQDELNVIQQQMKDPEFVTRSQIEQESLMRRADYLVEQSVLAASNVPYLLDIGKRRLQEVQQNADNLNAVQQANLDMESKLQSAEADWLHEVNVRKQLDVAQGVGIWGGPLLVALLAGNDFRPDERTAMAAVDIFQSVAIMQAGMSPDAALTSSRFRRARIHNAARSEGETFGSLKGFATELFMSSISKLSQDASDTLANRFQTHGAAIGLATEFLGTFASLGLSRAFSYLNPSPYHDVSTDDFIRSLQGMFIVRAWNTWQEALQQPEEEVEYQDPEDVLAYLEFKPATSAEEMQAMALNEWL